MNKVVRIYVHIYVHISDKLFRLNIAIADLVYVHYTKHTYLLQNGFKAFSYVHVSVLLS